MNIIKDGNNSIDFTILGMLSNNVYYLRSDEEKVIVDPSCHYEEIITLAEGTDISKILITHYHFDHTGAAFDIRENTKAKTYASTIDSKNIEDTSNILMPHKKTKNCEVDYKLKDNDEIKIGNSSWTVLETPGHSPGSICFYSEDFYKKPILICGDTLFHCSCGRTDFPDGSISDMKNSLSRLAKLPDDTIVLPGHGETTTIATERNYLLR